MNDSAAGDGGKKRKKGRWRKTMTPAALAANRSNAQHSTGATSEAGKEASSHNATSHRLTATKMSILVEGKEDAEEYEALHHALLEEYRPVFVPDQWMVRQLGNAMWSVIRANRAQIAAIKDAIRTGGRDIPADDVLARVFGVKPRDPADGWHRTSSGVEAAAKALSMFIADARANLYEEAAFWRWVRDTATDLKPVVPRMAPLVDANDQTMTETAVLEVLEQATLDLQARAAKLKHKEDERRALTEELALIPDTRAFHLIMRYTAAADRTVRRGMKLLAPLRRQARPAA